ncbi:unnamed protein product [Coffea canephora]|uniref:CP12 domain-containing protein n=1 Tax=Coffea canephora TaxID=49390 RepID=A0A068V8F3_COFCA|nr:unnamed protein product [Coffea canephora]
MAAIAGVSLSTPQILLFKASHSTLKFPCLNHPCKSSTTAHFVHRGLSVRPLAAAPERLSDQVAESVKHAEEACAGDPESGECAAAWDEVEELSAAASHARDRKKETDVLEDYCKDNPETEECRTYDN